MFGGDAPAGQVWRSRSVYSSTASSPATTRRVPLVALVRSLTAAVALVTDCRWG